MPSVCGQEEIILLIAKHCADDPIIEVFCGSGWLISNLKAKRRLGIDKDVYREWLLPKRGRPRHGIDLMAPRDPLYRQAIFDEWLSENQETWREAKTIVMCYPLGPFDPRHSGHQVVEALLEHQRLVLVSPRPYNNISVAGTIGMWEAIIDTMTLLSIEPVAKQHLDMIYVMRRGYDPKTRELLLGDHGIWELQSPTNLK